MVIDSEALQQIVCATLGVNHDDSFFKSRKTNVLFARYIAIFFEKNINNTPLVKIALDYKRGNHSTVSHDLKTTKLLIKNHKPFLKKYTLCAHELREYSSFNFNAIPQF